MAYAEIMRAHRLPQTHKSFTKNMSLEAHKSSLEPNSSADT
jgi:hypothetical protein